MSVLAVLLVAAVAAGDVAAPNEASFPRQCRGFLRSGHLRLGSVWGAYELADGSPTAVAAFSPEGSRLFTGGAVWLRAWDASTGEELWSVRAPRLAALAATAEGRLIMAIAADGRVTVRAGDDGRTEWSAVAHGAPVSAPAISPDGRIAVSGDWTGRVVVWDLHARRAARTLEAGFTIARMELSPDGKLVFAGDGRWGGRAVVWNAETGLPATDAERTTARAWLTRAGETAATAASRDGAVSLGGGGGRFSIVRTRGGTLGPSPGHGGTVTAVALSPDGARVLSAGGDGSVELRDASSGRELWRIPTLVEAEAVEPSAVTFAPGGDVIVGASGERAVLHRLSGSNGAPVRAETMAEGHVRMEAFSPALQLFATRSVVPARGAPRIVRRSGARVWAGAKDARVLAVTDGGAALVSRGKMVEVLTASGGPRLAVLSAPNGVSAGALSPDGRLAAVGAEDGTVVLWDVESNRELERVDLSSSTDQATALAIGPGARSLLVGTARGVVLRFDRE